MRGNDFLDKMELVDLKYVEAADAPKARSTHNRKIVLLIAAAVLTLLATGAAYIVSNLIVDVNNVAVEKSDIVNIPTIDLSDSDIENLKAAGFSDSQINSIDREYRLNQFSATRLPQLALEYNVEYENRLAYDFIENGDAYCEVGAFMNNNQVFTFCHTNDESIKTETVLYVLLYDTTTEEYNWEKVAFEETGAYTATITTETGSLIKAADLLVHSEMFEISNSNTITESIDDELAKEYQSFRDEISSDKTTSSFTVSLSKALEDASDIEVPEAFYMNFTEFAEEYGFETEASEAFVYSYQELMYGQERHLEISEQYGVEYLREGQYLLRNFGEATVEFGSFMNMEQAFVYCHTDNSELDYEVRVFVYLYNPQTYETKLEYTVLDMKGSGTVTVTAQEGWLVAKMHTCFCSDYYYSAGSSYTQWQDSDEQFIMVDGSIANISKDTISKLDNQYQQIEKDLNSPANFRWKIPF